MSDYDVLVIGSGAAGQTVAGACAKAGKSVVVVDRLPFGGTCALRGCIPKKVLLAGAEATARVKMLAGKGVEGSCVIDWPSLMQYKRTYTDDVPGRTEAWMHEMGIVTLNGTARFLAPDVVTVDNSRIDARAVVLATGARAVPLNIDGEHHVITSTEFLSLDQIPDRVAFIGGGYISFEFAWLAHQAGADVTIVHRSSQVLNGFDPWLADKVAQRYRKAGIKVLTDAPVERVESADIGLLVVAGAHRIESDMVVHGAGRAPDLQELDLEAGNVSYSRRGVSVDQRLRSTTNPSVWALGDASDLGAPLTPVASVQGEIVAANILGGDREFSDLATPSIVFSDPPLARVGLSAQSAARDEGLAVREFDMDDWFTQSRVGNDTAGAKLIVDVGTGAIKGAHVLGIDADQLINVFTLAVQFGITEEQLRTVSWAYPSPSYEINYLTGRY